MLYTTYLAKIDKLPEDCTKLIITRFPPKWLNLSKYQNTCICKTLSPSENLLLKYKKDNNWDNFVKGFYEEMMYLQMQIVLNSLLKYLQNKDLCLVCYEKDYTHCHRYLLAQWFVEKGIKWKEI